MGRKSAALQIIQLAELVKRFTHNDGNVGEIVLQCTITGQNGHLRIRPTGANHG
jgi:hypothetical protein